MACDNTLRRDDCGDDYEVTTTHGGDGDAAMIMIVDVFLVVYFPAHDGCTRSNCDMLMYIVDSKHCPVKGKARYILSAAELARPGAATVSFP